MLNKHFKISNCKIGINLQLNGASNIITKSNIIINNYKNLNNLKRNYFK